ncbi:DUF5071 domain-containing protein [Metabacillus fastidiosus]|uniref:DUF5071 domain-containing protein n=1 Tax=Metabacillus fastidiosus TaxID=1458 RepID=UPI002E1BA3B6|nr:DUF5071 domain-containing protein [Metabacillus fastidiosus]
MNKYENYLPRDKHDFERINELKRREKEELLPLLPFLIEWVQDMNWPIAHDIAELLLTFPNEIVPLIKDILAEKDDIWKYWCLEVLMKELPLSVIKQFQAELIRLAEEPTDGEKLEELDETAMEILKVLR